jgi:hypothetical protein
MLCPKEYLVAQARFKASGATIHRLNNVLAIYMASAETFNMTPLDDEFKKKCERAFEEAESEITAFCISGRLRLSSAEPSTQTSAPALC